MKYVSYLKKGLRLLHRNRMQPEYVTFFVTNKCNAQCGHCFYWKDLNTRVDELRLEEIEKIAAHMGEFSFLILTGGEPFIRTDIAEIASIFYRQNHVRNMNIMTMGYLSERIVDTVSRIMNTCPGFFVTLYISIDDVGGHHDRIRHIPGLYNKTLETMDRLKDIQARYPKLTLGVAMVYTSINQDRIATIYQEIRSQFRPDIVTCAFVRGDPKDNSVRTHHVGNYEIVQKMIEQDLMAGRLHRASDAIVGDLAAAAKLVSIEQLIKTVKEDRYQSPCYAGRMNVVIYPNADVVACEILNQKMGNLRDVQYDFKRIWLSARTKEITRHIVQSKCYCTHECNLLPNVVANHKFSRRILKKYVRLAFRKRQVR